MALLIKIVVIFFSAIRGVDRFRRSDGCEVSVSLVGEDHAVWERPFDTGGHRGRSTVGRDGTVDIEELVGEYRAADRGYHNRLVRQFHLVQDFGDQAMGDSVQAARAVGELFRG